MGRTQQLRQWVELWLGWLSKKRHLYQKLADQAVITTWSETSVFHLLRQASSTQKHSQQSSPPRRGPAGTWQDGDRKHSPLSLLLRATCWPLYLCLNVAGWCGCCTLQCHQCDSTHPTSSYPSPHLYFIPSHIHPFDHIPYPFLSLHHITPTLMHAWKGMREWKWLKIRK